VGRVTLKVSPSIDVSNANTSPYSPLVQWLMVCAPHKLGVFRIVQDCHDNLRINA